MIIVEKKNPTQHACCWVFAAMVVTDRKVLGTSRERFFSFN